MLDAQSYSLGDAYHPFSDEQRENPYPFYAKLRQEEKIVYSPEIDAWLVTRYHDVHTILLQPDIFSSKDVTRPVTNLTSATREILQQGYPMVANAISSDGLRHRRFRYPYIEALSATQTAKHEKYTYMVVDRLIDAIIDARHADAISQFAYPLTLEMVLYTMGIPQERMSDALKWSRQLISFLYSPLAEEQQIECAKGLVSFQHFIADIIKARQKDRQEDIISTMIHVQLPDAEPLSMNELVSALCGLVMAGHKTTIDLIGNGLALLLDPISRWRELCQHPEYIPATIEEILRYDSPVQALSRTTTCETKVGDVTLPAGARVLLIFGAANRDEHHCPHAENFEPRRTPNRHLGFGYGIHFCVGAPLARLEGRAAFERLTQRLPQMRLASHQYFVHSPILAFRGYKQLIIEWM